MRVIHVVPSVAEEASGPSYSVVRLCESLIETGADARLAALDGALGPDRPRISRHFLSGWVRGGLEVTADAPVAGRQATSGQVDLIHNHSLWMMPNVYPGKVCRRYSNCRLMVSPHGTLSRWALGFHALRKKVFWRLLQGPAVRGAACFHATSESEYQDIRELGLSSRFAFSQTASTCRH